MNCIRPSVIASLVLYNSLSVSGADVAPFEYQLSLKLKSDQTTRFGAYHDIGPLYFQAASLKRTPGDTAGFFVEVKATSDENGIVAVARNEFPFRDKPVYPPTRPERTFHFEVESLQFDANGRVPIEVRFKDRTDRFALTYDGKNGLLLVADDGQGGKVGSISVPNFANISLIEGDTVWQCNPLTVSARKSGKSIWHCDLVMGGEPATITSVNQLLFVTTTQDHSFYVRKHDGELVFYQQSKLSGRNPGDEILTLWQHALIDSSREKKPRPWLYRYVRAMVLLNDRRAIPLLIESIGKGFGLHEKCAAVAALEKFNGNTELWIEPKKPNRWNPPPDILRVVGMERVYPQSAREAEIAKWKEVFKSELK